MVRSMTGFATAERDLGTVTVHLELRSINSRYLDLVFRMPDECRQSEPVLRERLTGALVRGKVECRINLQTKDGETGAGGPDEAALLRLAGVQDAVRRHFPAATPLSVAEVLRWPGVLGSAGVADDELQAVLPVLLAVALDDFIASREREGARLAELIRQRVVRMRELVAEQMPRVREMVADYQARLTQRLREALVSADEERIRQEVVLFAQRSDIDEEFGRLHAHLDEVDRILARGGAAGKRLDFLMQELNREANTFSAKSVAKDQTAAAVELKVLIEQMREQVQNIE